MALDSLYSLTFEEFGNAVAGKREVHEIQERSNWERTRWQTALLLSVHAKKGQKIRPRDLALFEWEKKSNHPRTFETNTKPSPHLL